MKELIRHAHGIYNYCFDPYGNLYDKLTGDIEQKNLSLDRQKLVLTFMSFLMETKVVSNTTRLYIKSRFSTIKEVVNYFNNEHPEVEHINVNTAISKLTYDKNKMAKMFDDDFITKVVYSKDCNIDKYQKQLVLAMMKYDNRQSVLSNLTFAIPKDSLVYDCSDEDFDEIIEIISPYSKKTINKVVDYMSDKGFTGYLNYLTSTTNLSDIEKKRLKELDELLR